MKTAQQWLDKIQEGQMAECVHYEIHKQMGPSVSMLDWIEMIQHDAQDDFTNQVAELKSLVDAGMHESADLCNRLAEAKADNAKLHDLLGPTVELLESMLEYQKRYRQPHVEDIKKELARLRAAREGKV